MNTKKSVISAALAVLLTLGLIGCSTKTVDNFQESETTSEQVFVKANGKTILDLNGEEIQLKGTNLGNWLVPEGYMFKFEQVNSPRKIDEFLYELIGPDSLDAFWESYLQTYITQDDIKYLKKIGLNHVRLPFHYKLFTQDKYMGGRNLGFQYCDSLVKWCKEENIYVLLDMHCAPGGQTGDNIDDSYGYPYLLVSGSSQQLMSDVWVQIAEHYKDEPIILGYDLVNEPIAHYFDDEMDTLNKNLFALYERLIDDIRLVDTNHLIFVNGSRWSTRFNVFTEPLGDNVVYEFHKYWMPAVQKEIQDYIDFQNKYDVPIYVGETGENTDEWVLQFRDLLDSNEVNWCFWPYKKMNNPKGIMNFEQPAIYDTLINYALSDRSSYAKIRENRPNRSIAQEALNQYLENSKLENNFENTGYIESLGFVPQNKK